jgi:hypothetical protein
MKNNRVKELLEKRKIPFGAKVSKMGETVYQCVIFRKIAKITEIPNFIYVEYPFGERDKQRFDNIESFKYYLDGGKL